MQTAFCRRGNQLYLWIGGRDVKADDLELVFETLLKIAETGKVEQVYNYLGVRE